MPSLLHEGIIALVREKPAFAADLLRDVLHVSVPAFSSARLSEATFNNLVPAEYSADAVVLLGNEDTVFGIIIEAQLRDDPQKFFTWPLYAVTARAQHKCPFVVLVVTPSEPTDGTTTYRPRSRSRWPRPPARPACPSQHGCYTSR